MMTLKDKTGKELRSVPVRFGEVVLIENNSEHQVLLDRTWFPSRKATSRDILKNFNNLMKKHQSRGQKAN